MEVTADTMLGSIECHNFYAWGIGENVDGRFEFVINARGIGDKSHALATENVEIIIAKHFHAGLHLCGECHGDAGESAEYYVSFHFLRPKLGSILRNAHMPIVAAQHIIVQIKK